MKFFVMKKNNCSVFQIVLLSCLLVLAETAFAQEDPDMPDFLRSTMSKEEFMQRRADAIAMKRGVEKDKPFDPANRINAIRQMEEQKRAIAASGANSRITALNWTEIGPNPIPNGQVVSGAQLPVSGRTICIAVHPTNANIVYVGTAQGGLYRTTDGGATWTPLMDNALSLAIGTVAISPSQPETIYVGTGEPNFSADSYFGVGIYRIDNASSASPVISGPFGGTSFAGRSVAKIIVHPTNPAIIFACSTSGVGGIVATATSPLPNRGVYRSTDATSASPTFTQIGVLASPSNNISVRDIAIDPNNPNILLANLVINTTGGIMRSTDALAATPTWTQSFAFNTGTSTSNLTAEFAAIHPAGDLNATFYAAVGNTATGSGAGRILKSTDGGATFAQVSATTFCSGQCFYNIAIDVDPTNVNNVYMGGTGANTFSRSSNGGTTFAASQANLHTDTHAIGVAPSSPSTIYFGSDGGIYKSIDGGTTWASLNNATFRATQFMGISVHPTDPNYTIGGTQDNGTEYRNSAGTWIRADGGDGGYTVIDQSSVNTTNVNQYHTYFNASTQTGYAAATTTGGGWTFRGCLGVTTNGITCTSVINFYAPLERGPGTPNAVYYGADRLYRTVDVGVNHATVSQTFTSPISAIGIAPQDDNVRIIGSNSGALFGTTTGSATLTDLDAGGTVPNSPIGRTVIDPTNANTAYVTISAFNVTNVWKTTNLNNANPTWTAAAGSGGTALPRVPVNSFLVVPSNSNILFAGTDIGVYFSANGGATWSPYGTGLPVVAVFGMALTNNGFLRIATHGRGMWQVSILSTLPLKWVGITGNLNNQKHAVINWKVEENNVAQYGVEKSDDGRMFSPVGNLNSKGDGTNDYSLTESIPLTGTGYYRVKQTDFDGKATYSLIIKLVNSYSSYISLFPSPARDAVTVTVGNALLKTKAEIVDLNGKLLKTMIIQNSSFIIDISTYANGIYLLKFDNGVVKKIDKQ
jgi:Secretion system C-terminal sorting domain